MDLKVTPKTPGYDTRLAIRFSVSEKGAKAAHYWLHAHSPGHLELSESVRLRAHNRFCGLRGWGQWIRINLSVAKALLDADQVDRYVADSEHPFDADLGDTVWTTDAGLAI